MAINAGYDYGRLLSLDNADLVGRTRDNHLGTRELQLRYQLQNAAAKEDALEWLETNRLSITDPKFSNKTYEGTWHCVDIGYDEATPAITQRFKIDSALEGDVAARSAGGDVIKSYYWRIVDPTIYNIPDPVDEGDVWTKTVNDNGDGTYDVILSKTDQTNLEGGSESKVYGETNDYASNSIIVSQSGDPLIDGEYTFQGGSGPPDFFDGEPIGAETRNWEHVSSGYTIEYSNGWLLKDDGGVTVYTKTGLQLNSFGWLDGAASAFIVVQVGVNPPLYTETTDTYSSVPEVVFGTNPPPVGDVLDPTVGQEKTITNTPNGDGTFNATITTRTMNYQRIPAMEDSIIFAGDGNEFRDNNAYIWARNATYEQYQFDVNYMTNNKAQLSNVMSCTQNKWGLYDYTIRSTEI